MPTAQPEETVKLRWRGEDTVSLPWLGAVLATGDTVEVPASLVNLDGDPAAPGFFFPPEVWSVADGESKKKPEKSETPKVGE